MNSFVILALLLSIPVGIGLSFLLQKYRYIQRGWKNYILPSLGFCLVFCAICLGISYGSIALQIRDVEIISGEIISKEREHGHYQRSYECLCTTDSKGNRSCQTCYEDRYTVKWWTNSTIKPYTIKSLDEGSKRVYQTPDPERYTRIKIGDPVAAENSYDNYMLGVPKEHLYNDNLGASPQLIARIPSYPGVYDFYEVSRVLDIDGVLPTELEIQYNKSIAEKLKVSGPMKQVNIILLFGKHDENLVYAVREKWNGGKKNDVIVVVGMDGEQVKGVNVLTWAKNELFKIKLQDRIYENRVVDGILEIVFDEINKSYVRPRMRDYEDLKMYIEPSTNSLILIFVLLLISPFGVIVFNRFK